LHHLDLVEDTLFALVKLGEEDGSKIDGPYAIGDLVEPDPFTDQHSADVDEALVPLDAAVATDLANFEVAGIVDRRQLLGEGAWRRAVDRGWGLAVQRLRAAEISELGSATLERKASV
jgi:hypothetical protein